jgi:hypothetical protein
MPRVLRFDAGCGDTAGFVLKMKGMAAKAIFLNRAGVLRYLKDVEKGMVGLVSPTSRGVDPRPLSIRNG